MVVMTYPSVGAGCWTVGITVFEEHGVGNLIREKSAAMKGCCLYAWVARVYLGWWGLDNFWSVGLLGLLSFRSGSQALINFQTCTKHSHWLV